MQARIFAFQNSKAYVSSLEKLRTQISSQGGKDAAFSLRWHELFEKEAPFIDSLDSWVNEMKPRTTISLPPAGFVAALDTLKNFKTKLKNYKKDRDTPSCAGTSQLSFYFKNGSLSSAQVVHELKLSDQFWGEDSGETQYLKEIAWREFYYSILYHQPEVENRAFNTKFEKIKWKNDRNLFRRWCEGTTGFPIVDAGMRQLVETGWMHNRVRMIVASFLSKDLLIDWRWGEKFFMNHLLDGDLAPNNGGWQWAASTGCDPQPYFRVFNPWLQGAKFDPEGIYIKKYVPELQKISPKEIHDPEGIRFGYPRPVVVHGVQKNLALQLFEDAKKNFIEI